jgi:uridylate kinase
MAIGIGDTVLPGGALIIPNAMGPIQGIVVSGAGPFAIQWSNGESDASVAAAALDKVGLDATVANTLVGRMVRATLPANQTNYGSCLCAAVYSRAPAGANPATYALLVNLMTYTYFEVLAANVVVVD